MNQLEKDSLISGLKVALQYAERLPVTKDCVSCAYADMSGLPLRCKYFDANPPADVIKVGCDNYFYDKNSPPF